jgi:hypothetical protein
MKFLFTLLPLWLLACVAWAVNTVEQEFLCPICGTHWEQRVETSGQSRGLRLDLRQLGDVTDPPTLPQCSKCRFPLFSDRLLAQANDPSKAKAFKRLRSFVLGADFQMLVAKNPSYFALAQVQELLGAPHRHIALSYLRASWQAEDRGTLCRRLLEMARVHYVAALAETGPDDPRRTDIALVCGEVERRLEKWDDAEGRFRGIESSGILKGTPQAAIPAVQLRLIAQRDPAPHTLESAAAVVDHPSPGRELTIENTGRIALASAGEGKPDAMKLGSPATFSEELPAAATPQTPVPPVEPDAVPIEKTEVGAKLAAPPKIPGELPPAAPLEPPVPLLLLGPLLPFVPPLPPVKPDSNFSDNPD